jgi:xanthine dehydrogenase accessory factor
VPHIDDPLPRALAWHDAGHAVALATVIETWGSAPRPVGSHLAICDDGRLEGSVSGGCVEGDVLVNAEEILADGGFRRLDYGVADETAWTVGLPCGGTIRVLVQRVADDGYPPALLRHVVAALGRRESVRVVTDLATGRSRAETSDAVETAFVRPYAPQPRLVIVGAGHIGQALAPMASLAGFDVTVVDPRERFATADRFAGVRLDHRFPDEALAAHPLDQASALVALSHDPKIDDPALIAALGSPAFHIAALGSRRNQARRLERLADAGFNAAALARIHGPAGLPIGALTPAEIAISILAELVAARRGAAIRRAG